MHDIKMVVFFTDRFGDADTEEVEFSFSWPEHEFLHLASAMWYIPLSTEVVHRVECTAINDNGSKFAKTYTENEVMGYRARIAAGR